ncbi:hypothetical protein FCH33_18880 [Serratia fonticola]|uniref:hypothetical protein n=1 Tax=Serratia fonticola TaxID=47917 RepID=UPI00157516C5|nr:hypothetical protein [Serratia fonticola]NTY88840.1 hypothetical protein [Serratia fonticola]NTZ14402.1 hypothetical protein [Serratia fonticola]
MLGWIDFINMLGCSKLDGEIISLSQSLSEMPAVEPDMLGDRTYYSFFQSGILFLLEEGKVSQICFFITPSEGFSKYVGELPISGSATENEIITVLGEPSSTGGGKSDMLLGYIGRWIKYDKDNYALHIEFNQSALLSKVSLLAL